MHTRCGFVNVVFGFAARKASRHQLHKHVNAHVYLGVWRITLNSVQAVVGDPHDHVDKPFCVAQLSYSQIWEIQIGSCESRISMLFRLWKHIFTFTLISCTVKSSLLGVGCTASVTWFAVNRLWFVFPVLREQLHDDNMLVWCCARALAQRVAYWSSHVAGARACPGAAPDCTRAFALHSLRTRYALSWLHVMITSS